ncbi:Hypothetical predicted protein [Mytilus galloprovincialis]|uniref:Uncharacterized protein n=1 Tax=Mytilus galloprovincialis TaxID=29158 RepID=A0A8B6F5V3_MYTGA|nr:Hypothetical predicted protein [Mytilus galloprovincialis]
MENIPLSRLGFVLKQFIKIDNYKWYGTILKEHARSGFTIHEIPAPVFVARRMAYVQETDNFGILEMKNLLEPICNVAYLLNTQTPNISELKEYQPKYHTTFDAAYCKEVIKMEIKRNSIVRSHNYCVDQLRSLHKECGSLKKHWNQRTSKLETFLKINRIEGNVPKKFESKLKEIVQKRSKAEEKYTTAFTIFKHILNNEKALREELIELGALIKTTLITRMKSGITKAQEELDQAIFWINDHHGFNFVRNQLQSLKINEIVEALYKVTTAAYVTAIPEDFLEATGQTEFIPKIKYTQCDYKILGMNNGSYLKRSKKDKSHLVVFGEDNSGSLDDCFFPINGGVRVAPVKRSEEDSRGIFKVKTGYQVKMKLSLMNGSVGFGWIRKSFIHGAKKWGFYFLSPKDAQKVIGEASSAHEIDNFADFTNFYDDAHVTTEEENTSMHQIISTCIEDSEDLIVF